MFKLSINHLIKKKDKLVKSLNFEIDLLKLTNTNKYKEKFMKCLKLNDTKCEV